MNSQADNEFSVSPAYLKYVIALAWFVLLLRFVDLQIIAVLLEPIKTEFDLSDTQLGLLTGIAFSLFYGTLGIPIAWMADRYNRRNIVSVAIGLWSLMTALCGMATGFISLFLARIGVGIGEAGGSPPTFSLISDYVKPERRSTVFAILNSSTPIGVFVGFKVGGWVNEFFGWRAAFLIVGIPGIIVALLVRYTMKEPPRGYSDPGGKTITPLPFRQTIKDLIKIKSYVQIVIATCIMTMGAYGSGIWIPSFFIRTHGMSVAEIGTWLAFLYGGGGFVGSMLGGWFADRMVQKTGNKRWLTWVPAIAGVCILPFSLFVYLWHDPYMALPVHLGTTILMHVYLGPSYGTIQTLVGASKRAMASAINLLFINLIAFGMGPLLIGMASDFFNAQYGNDALRYSILTTVIVCYNWAAVHFYMASRSLQDELPN